MGEDKIKYRLKGHESFTLREGWVTKGLFALQADPWLFSENFGADGLGVGTNMAKAIRYWFRAMGLGEEQGRGKVTLSSLGRKLLAYDAYLEDPFSLWLLHGNLACNFEQATSWQVFFSGYDREEFTKGELMQDMEELMEELVPRFSLRSLQDDCEAILQMYARKRPAGADPEEKKGSPFYRLGLLREHDGSFRREQPDAKELHPLAVLCVIQGCLETGQGYAGASCERLLRGERSPGRVLHLKRFSLMRYLEELERAGYLTLNRTAGLDMVYQDRIFSRDEITDDYFGGHAEDVRLKRFA